MGGEVGRLLGGEEEADGEVGEGREGEGGGVADGGGAGGDGDGGAAAEGEDVGGGEGDVACGGGEGDVGGGDGEGFGAELVGELDADERAAEGEMDGLAEGGVGAEQGGVVGAIGIGTVGVWTVGIGGGPGADPVVGGGVGLAAWAARVARARRSARGRGQEVGMVQTGSSSAGLGERCKGWVSRGWSRVQGERQKRA